MKDVIEACFREQSERPFMHDVVTAMSKWDPSTWLLVCCNYVIFFMKISLLFLLVMTAIIFYGVNSIGFPLWGWLGIALAIAGTLWFILPRIIILCINMFLSKKKGFSITCEKLYPFGVSIKNTDTSSSCKKFGFSVSVKGVSIQTNFKKAFFDFAASSPFVLEINALNIGVVAVKQEQCNSVSSTDSNNRSISTMDQKQVSSTPMENSQSPEKGKDSISSFWFLYRIQISPISYPIVQVF